MKIVTISSIQSQFDTGPVYVFTFYWTNTTESKTSHIFAQIVRIVSFSYLFNLTNGIRRRDFNNVAPIPF